MSYGKDLLDRATAKAGSRYALSKLTGLAESHMSEVVKGKRDVPASWVLPLARVAEVDPTEAMEFWDLERAEKKRLRRLSSSSAAGGVAATLLTFAASVVPDHHALAMSGRLAIDTSTHRISETRSYRGAPPAANGCKTLGAPAESGGKDDTGRNS